MGDVYVVEENGDKIKIGTIRRSANTIQSCSLIANVDGYTNAYGEWIYGAANGNTVEIFVSLNN
jgi:hypothetical protein